MGSEHQSPARTAVINRDTNETKIQVSLSLDGGVLEPFPSSPHFPSTSGHSSDSAQKTHASQSSSSQQVDIDTGIGFLDHMLHALAKHAGWSLRVRCKGDLYSTSSVPSCPFDWPYGGKTGQWGTLGS